SQLICYLFIFSTPTPTTAIHTLSLHDALPIFTSSRTPQRRSPRNPSGSISAVAIDWPCNDFTGWRHSARRCITFATLRVPRRARSEEHTSELQSRSDLVCRLLLEKKKKKKTDL